MAVGGWAVVSSPAKFSTAGIGRMVHPPKNDLFSISDFVTFTIRIVKMYVILVDYDGNAVSLGHMHAGINCIIK